MLIKKWYEALNESIEEYMDNGRIVIIEGWTPSQNTYGGFWCLSFFVLCMLVILPFVLIGTILQIPLFLLGKLILFIYKRRNK